MSNHTVITEMFEHFGYDVDVVQTKFAHQVCLRKRLFGPVSQA